MISSLTNKKIILAGGSGFIGQELARFYAPHNKVIILGREMKLVKTNNFGSSLVSEKEYPNLQYVKWDAKVPGEWVHALEGADILINLTGKTVNCRYNEKNKKEIFDSRTDAVKALGLALQQLTRPPKLWINAASATIYRHATDRPQDEDSGELGTGFSVEVCKLWEKTFYEQRTPFTRKVALRMAITLGAGGVMTPYFNLLKFGLGGKQGNGNQMYSWIHITDTCRMIDWIYNHDDMEGTYNCSSPNPVTNKVFMSSLRKATGYKFGLPASTWMLKFGALLIGTETELVLKSRWVVPTKVQETGFHFEYPLITDAFKEIIAKTERKKYHLF